MICPNGHGKIHYPPIAAVRGRPQKPLPVAELITANDKIWHFSIETTQGIYRRWCCWQTKHGIVETPGAVVLARLGGKSTKFVLLLGAKNEC
jgi:hypothetical protein